MSPRWNLVCFFILFALLGCQQEPSFEATQNESAVFEPPFDSLPVCPTITATNCRIVPGETKETEGPEPSVGLRPSDGPESIRCSGTGPVPLISPMRIEDVGIILPMGAMIGNHVTPIDHMYFQPMVFRSAPDTYPVYANADGIITEIGSEPLGGENRYHKYRVVIQHTCDFYSIYNLLTSLSPEIESITGPIAPGDWYRGSEPIAMKQGEVIGWIGGQTLDLSVNYDPVTLGFIVPEHYESESWKIHTVDPFDYIREPDKSQLLAKNLRQVEPRGGKIDYDIEGRLSGNWFVAGGGYNTAGPDEGYWKTHVAFAYDSIDPSHIIVSLGNFPDVAQGSTLNAHDRSLMQFSVKGNGPDPKDISVSTGLVKYELVETSYVHGNSNRYWDRMSYASDIRAKGENEVKAVVLAQLVSARELRLEIFPGKTASQVSGFSSPTIYGR